MAGSLTELSAHRFGRAKEELQTAELLMQSKKLSAVHLLPRVQAARAGGSLVRIAMMSDKKTQIEELTLMLLYLTSWKESAMPSLRLKPLKDGEAFVLRAWKGYDHGALDALAEQELISNRSGKTPLVVREEGAVRAQELMKKYGFIPVDEDCPEVTPEKAKKFKRVNPPRRFEKE